MKKITEIMHVPDKNVETFMQDQLHPSEKAAQLLWLHNVRNRAYFQLGNSIIMTFDYVGDHFKQDMDALAVYPEIQELYITRRLRDVPQEERDTTAWWAPMKYLGAALKKNPFPDDEDEQAKLESRLCAMGDDYARSYGASINTDISYDEDDWAESIHL